MAKKPNPNIPNLSTGMSNLYIYSDMEVDEPESPTTPNTMRYFNTVEKYSRHGVIIVLCKSLPILFNCVCRKQLSVIFATHATNTGTSIFSGQINKPGQAVSSSQQQTNQPSTSTATSATAAAQQVSTASAQTQPTVPSTVPQPMTPLTKYANVLNETKARLHFKLYF